MKTLRRSTGFAALLLSMVVTSLPAQQSDPTSDTVKGTGQQTYRPILVPLTQYVTCGPVAGSSEKTPATITLDEAMQLRVHLLRDQLPHNCGVQFLTIAISIYNKRGTLVDKIIKHTFTFPRKENEAEDRLQIHRYAEQILPFGFVSERKMESVTVLNDTVPEWSLIKVEVTPDDEYTKFAERLKLKVEWWYRVKGNRFEEEFFLGIPKVLYDTERTDTITYGNVSAMLRFYYLNGETGERFPVNLGIGTFGVSNPIDVSSTGGGFAISLLLDLIQSARLMYDIDILTKANAGIEVTPFFPISRKSRILINARIGYAL